jgi:formylglycine-generating enzyme required for sulfatase activity
MKFTATMIFLIATMAISVFIGCSRYQETGQQYEEAEISVPEGFVQIESGNFIMGSPHEEPGRKSNEGPMRTIRLGGFFMGMFPVTQAKYEEVMGVNPSRFSGPDLPVENVSWFDAIEFCNRLSLRDGLEPAYIICISGEHRTVSWNPYANGYRLPTEAEWEYACRAGTFTPFSTGNNITTDQANFDGNFPFNNNDRGAYRASTSPVGSFAPNPWGLYDMHGNVFEWCWDWYGVYPSKAETDPIGAAFGTGRVIRGGSWTDDGHFLRSATRNSANPSFRYIFGGFRLVRCVPE